MKNKKYILGWLLIATIALLALAACQPAEPVEVDLTQVAAEIATAEATPEEQVAIDIADLVATNAAPVEPITLEGATTTDSGLQYIMLVEGDGETPQAGDIVSIHYAVSLPDGTEVANSYSQGQPAVAVLGRDQLLPGWEEGILLMKAGGKIKLLLPPDLAFGEQGYGVVPANSQLLMEVELLSIKLPPTATEVDSADLTTTDSGLRYYDITVGSGKAAEKGSTVTTDYAIWVQGETENLFIAESTDTQPITFVVGRGDTVFPGWEEGVTGMQPGGKRLLIIPPALALGETGGGEIPANATLIMEIGLTEVKAPILMTPVDEADYTTTESGLKYYDFAEGTGDSPTTGQTVVVHYTGWLEDGTVFDSSVERGQPFSFPLGTGSVIPGWDEGVATMKVGGKRQLVIPPELGYGDSGAGGVIPPGATLIFEVELLEIQEQQ